jgi:hypothetical protein
MYTARFYSTAQVREYTEGRCIQLGFYSTAQVRDYTEESRVDVYS